MPPENDFEPTREQGYEKRDASIRGLLLFGLFLAAVLVITFFGMKWTFEWLAAKTPLGPPAAPFENARQLPPAPRLQANPHEDLETFCAGQLEELSSNGWVDQQNGIVHIPIVRAMDLMLQQGYPARPESEISPYDKQAIAPVGTVNAQPPTGIGGQCAFVNEHPGAGYSKSYNGSPRGAR